MNAPLRAASGLLVLPLLVLCGPSASSQVFVRNTADIPASTGETENVDFADIDGDGDWDAAFADGGDSGSQQNRIWRNAGGAQGGTVGVFTNVTATQAPAILDASRDIEFVDYDGDGDVDLSVSNDSTIINQPCRWWTNQGGSQAGTIGFYQDETAARWVGLGGPGSSVPPSHVLAAGGFVDWVGDSDFGDLDNDGDLDLVHSSFGPSFSGNVPTRLFLNDGQGYFSEFNPSGFQLAGINIANGSPGLWCEGTQSANTANATGTSCDIASSALDVDVGDIDGDLDLDILHGARQELPRMFANRLEENGGLVLGFRDLTTAVFPAGYANGNGHYEQELGDFDNDGDLDILGLNWIVTSFAFEDVALANLGNGTYGAPSVLPNSQSDDNEVDFIDYDQDGDVDAFTANFSGQDRMYENDGAGGYAFLPTGTVLPSDGTLSYDADMADVDGDGDSDLFVANGATQAEWYLENTILANDASAPRLYRLEQAPNRPASAVPTVVRVQGYDNAAYYNAWYNPTILEVQVDGGPVQTYPMRSSQGQVFRGEIPGSLVGAISYRAVSSDPYGNTGSTLPLSYVAVSPSPLGTAFCFGDGSLSTPCPCNNTGQPGRGCENSSATGGALLAAVGTVSPDTATLQANGLLASPAAVFLQGSASVPNGAAFGDGLRCTTGVLKRLAVKIAVAGTVSYPETGDPSISARSYALGDPLFPGTTRYYQVYYRDPDLVFCPAPVGNTWNISAGLQLIW